MECLTKKKMAYSNEYLVAAKDPVVMCRLMKSRKLREKLKKILIPTPNVVLRMTPRIIRHITSAVSPSAGALSSSNCFLLMSSPSTIRELVRDADVVVGAVLLTGAKAPRLVTREMLKTMKPGSVLVDVAIDQGGCFETSKATTHSDPIYTVDGVIHYCVANMPGAVAKTSTLALTNATMPYAADIASKGWRKAMQQNPEIKLGANVVNGKITYQGVADAFGLEYYPIDEII